MLLTLRKCKKCFLGCNTGLADQTDNSQCVVPNVFGCRKFPPLLMLRQHHFHMLPVLRWVQMEYISALTKTVVGHSPSTPGNCMHAGLFLGCQIGRAHVLTPVTFRSRMP